MLCSSSSSDLFCPSHPLFFPPPAPILPPFAWFQFLCPDPPSPQRTPAVCPPSALSSQQPPGLCVPGMGEDGHGGHILTLLEGEDVGAVECGIEMQPRSKMCNKSGAGAAESRTPLWAAKLKEHEPHHFDFPPLPVPTPFSLAGWWREELQQRGCGVSVSRRRGCTYAHIHLVVPV